MPSRLGCMLTFMEGRRGCARDSAGAMQAPGASSDLGVAKKMPSMQSSVLRRDVPRACCDIRNAFSMRKSGRQTIVGIHWCGVVALGVALHCGEAAVPSALGVVVSAPRLAGGLPGDVEHLAENVVCRYIVGVYDCLRQGEDVSVYGGVLLVRAPGGFDGELHVFDPDEAEHEDDGGLLVEFLRG